MIKAKHVPTKGGPPIGKFMNRPSIEYTGSGDQLCYDGWGGRWFRASIEAVKEGIQFLRESYVDGDCPNYNDLYKLWNMCQTELGAQFGWSSSEDYLCDMDFLVTLYQVGEHDYADKMGESVLIIEPDPRTSLPFEGYLEV